MYDSQSLGHELLKRVDAWRDAQTRAHTPWSAQIEDAANDLIAGDAVIIPHPKSIMARLRLLWASFA